MVGVPGLVRWVCGPSCAPPGRPCSAVSLRMTAGPREQADGIAVMRGEHRAEGDVVEDVSATDVLLREYWASQSSMLVGVLAIVCRSVQVLDDALHLHEARALDQHVASGDRAQRSTSAASIRRSCSKWRAPAPTLRGVTRQLAQRAARARCRALARRRRFLRGTPALRADSPMSPITSMRGAGQPASTSIAARIESGLAL